MHWTEAKRQGVNQITERLFQRGHFLTWPYARKHQMLRDLQITLVVNLWLKNDPDLSGMAVINLPMPGDEAPKNANALIRAVALWNGGVLVHCEAGVNRSAWFCGRVLIAKGYEPDMAYQRLVAGIPNLKMHTALKADLLGPFLPHEKPTPQEVPVVY